MRHAAGCRRAALIGTRQPRQKRLRTAIHSQRLVFLPNLIEQFGDRRQAPANVGYYTRVSLRLGRQRLPCRQNRLVRRQRGLSAANLASQLSQLEVRFRQCPPRGEVKLLPKSDT